jgi:glycyl-tRNA synthetase beta chain
MPRSCAPATSSSIPPSAAASSRNGAAAAAAAAGLTLVEDNGLLDENAGLTEWPVPLLGRFDPAFLGGPREVIQLTMRTNQKYFACTDAAGNLAPNFVCTANIEAADGRRGDRARQRTRPFRRLSTPNLLGAGPQGQARGPGKKLGQIVFHEKLGTVADKVERVAKLARWLVEEGIVKVLPGRGGGPGEAVEGASLPQSAGAPSTTCGVPLPAGRISPPSPNAPRACARPISSPAWSASSPSSRA